MAYVTSKEMLLKAQKGGYAVPALNAENLEMIQAIIEAASETNSPVIIQTTPSTVKYLTLDEAYAMVYAMASKASVPVCLHLDHCESFEGVMQAIKAGYSSVMIDGSKSDFETNVGLTKKVVSSAHAMSVPVEAELGTVGGKEDSLSGHVAYTDPDKAVEFAANTGIDIFAVAIGTSHGIYKAEPKLDFDLLKKINQRISIPLVLHGASGIPDGMIKETIKYGICKVNFATELRIAATKAVRLALNDTEMFDPKKYLGPARQAVKELAISKIKLCGSENKA